MSKGGFCPSRSARPCVHADVQAVFGKSSPTPLHLLLACFFGYYSIIWRCVPDCISDLLL